MLVGVESKTEIVWADEPCTAQVLHERIAHAREIRVGTRTVDHTRYRQLLRLGGAPPPNCHAHAIGAFIAEHSRGMNGELSARAQGIDPRRCNGCRSMAVRFPVRAKMPEKAQSLLPRQGLPQRWRIVAN